MNTENTITAMTVMIDISVIKKYHSEMNSETLRMEARPPACERRHPSYRVDYSVGSY